jgi:antitoxin (DNA-binding transcriptional repressor) of toxin-antitoxin stability system
MTEIDLVDWTIQEAQQLKSERCQPSDLDGGPVLDRLLAVLEPDPVGATNSEEPVARIASAPSTQMAVEEPTSTSGQAVAVPEPDAASDLSAVAQTASWTSAEARAEKPKSDLLMAILAPDIYTARADRDRAIALRWVLRDIKNNRLKWWPVDQHDLRDLIDMGLVELRNDARVLTSTGVNAII